MREGCDGCVGFLYFLISKHSPLLFPLNSWGISPHFIMSPMRLSITVSVPGLSEMSM